MRMGKINTRKGIREIGCFRPFSLQDHFLSGDTLHHHLSPLRYPLSLFLLWWHHNHHHHHNHHSFSTKTPSSMEAAITLPPTTVEGSVGKGLSVRALILQGVLQAKGCGGMIPWKLHVTGKHFHSGLAHKALPLLRGNLTKYWVGDCFIYNNSSWRLNYYVGGELVKATEDVGKHSSLPTINSEPAAQNDSSVKHDQGGQPGKEISGVSATPVQDQSGNDMVKHISFGIDALIYSSSRCDSLEANWGSVSDSHS